MSQPSNAVLQKLRHLNESSSGYCDQLSNTLYGEDYARCVTVLNGDDLQWLVDYLDSAFSNLPPLSAASRKCLRELRSICETKEILPKPYVLSPSLTTIATSPFAAGGFGDVYHGSYDGNEVCAKRARVYSLEDQRKVTRTFYREAVIWGRLKHRNIVPFLGVTFTPHYQLISSWMPGGHLRDYVKNNVNADRLCLLLDVAQGLQYLHSCSVIHGDLKGDNILIDASLRARIVDFGLATVARSSDSAQNTTNNNNFTPRWTAPEILDGKRHSQEGDIFSFAMVMIEVYTGAVPFYERVYSAAICDIVGGKRPPKPVFPTFTDRLWTLMQRCWEKDPLLRPTIVEVLSDLRGVDHPTWKSLISDGLSIHERISLVTMIFLDKSQVKTVNNLSKDDAQLFIDKIDQVLDVLPPRMHKRCLRYLYKMSGLQAVFPRSLEIPLSLDPAGSSARHEGLTEVWRCQYDSRDTAVQVSRILPGDDPEEIKRGFCREVVAWRALHHPNILPLLGVTTTDDRLVTVSEWMSRGRIMRFIKTNPDIDRLRFLRGITRGLIYMHDQGIIHGDLRGANVLIDTDGCARLAGFNQVMMASDHSTVTPPSRKRSSTPWTSPELLDPQSFDLKDYSPTVRSDCYALGMVIYEVLSGHAPFAEYRDYQLVLMILEKERPKRPHGDEGRLFTDEIWNMLQHCWEHRPDKRSTARRILMVLEGNASPPWSYSDVDEDQEVDLDDQSVDDANDGPKMAGESQSRNEHVVEDGNGMVGPAENGMESGMRREHEMERVENETVVGVPPGMGDVSGIDSGGSRERAEPVGLQTPPAPETPTIRQRAGSQVGVRFGLALRNIFRR